MSMSPAQSVPMKGTHGIKSGICWQKRILRMVFAWACLVEAKDGSAYVLYVVRCFLQQREVRRKCRKLEARQRQVYCHDYNVRDFGYGRTK